MKKVGENFDPLRNPGFVLAYDGSRAFAFGVQKQLYSTIAVSKFE